MQLLVAILAFSLHLYRLGPSTALPVVIVWVNFPFSVNIELLFFLSESSFVPKFGCLDSVGVFLNVQISALYHNVQWIGRETCLSAQGWAC